MDRYDTCSEQDPGAYAHMPNPHFYTFLRADYRSKMEPYQVEKVFLNAKHKITHYFLAILQGLYYRAT